MTGLKIALEDEQGEDDTPIGAGNGLLFGSLEEELEVVGQADKNVVTNAPDLDGNGATGIRPDIGVVTKKQAAVLSQGGHPGGDIPRLAIGQILGVNRIVHEQTFQDE